MRCLRFNRSVNTDAQVRPLAVLPPCLGRRLPLRYRASEALLVFQRP